MEKTPSAESIKEWLAVRTKEQAFKWHLKYTPWFSPMECAKIVTLYDVNKFNSEIKLENEDDINMKFKKMMIQNSRPVN
jgi:hypothetical protein